MSNQEPAARADLIWEANLGKLRADMGEAGVIYASTTGAMSEEALALAVKQDRLNRAIANSGPQSTAAKSATLNYRRELQALAATQSTVTKTSAESARASVVASVEQRRALRQVAVEYRALAAAAVRGSEEQVAATQLAIRAEAELAAAVGATNRHTRAGGSRLRDEERAAGRFGRGALAGTRSFAGRALAFGSTAFIGGVGAVYAVGKALGAAKEEEVALALVRNALANTGNSWKVYGTHIEEATSRLESTTAFTKVELLGAFGTLVRRTGDVKQSLNLVGTAADLARGRNIDLGAATNLLVRALNGQVGSLRRVGIDVQKVTAAQDELKASGQKASAQQIAQAKATDLLSTKAAILGAIRQKYGDQAAKFLTTEAGKQALLNARIHDSEAIIGRALAPAYDRLLTRTARYLDHANRTGVLQRKVNAAVKEGSAIIHDIGDAFHFAVTATSPLVKALGGVEKTAKLLITLRLAAVVRGWGISFGLLQGRAAASFGGIAASGAAAAARVETEAAAMDGALTRATRPRQIIINETFTGGIPGGIPGGGVGGGRPGASRGTLPQRVGEYGRNPQPITTPAPKSPGIPGTGGLAGLVLSGLALGQSGESEEATIAWNQQEDQYYAVAMGGRFHAKISSGQAKKQDPAFWTKIENFKREMKRRAQGGGPADYSSGAHSRPRPTAAAGGGKTKPGPPQTSLPFGLQNKMLDAERTPGQADDLRVYKEQQAALVKMLAQPGLTNQNILDIKGQLNSVTSQIEQIESAQRAATKDAFDKRRAARKEQLATQEQELKNDVLKAKTPAATRKAEDALVAFFKTEAGDLKLTAKERAHYAGQALKERKDQAKRAADDEKKLRAERIKILEKVPVDLAIAEQRARGSDDKDKLLSVLHREDAALKRQELQLKKIHAGKAALLAVLKNEAGIEKEIRAIEKEKSANQGANQREFLSSFASIVTRFAPNAFPAPAQASAKTDTYLYELVHENRQTNEHLTDIRRRGAFPASGYAAASAEAVTG